MHGHPHAAARRRYGQDGGEVTVGQIKTGTCAVRIGFTGEKVLIKCSKRNGRNIFGLVLSRCRVEDLHSVEFDTQIDRIVKLNEIANIDMKAAAKREQATLPWCKLAGGELESQVLVISDRFARINR